MQEIRKQPEVKILGRGIPQTGSIFGFDIFQQALQAMLIFFIKVHLNTRMSYCDAVYYKARAWSII
jgi:hypothetical protein